MKERWYKGETLIYFFENFKRKKILIFKILNSFLIVYFIKSPKSLLLLEYLEKNYFLNPLFQGKMIQRGDAYLLFWEFQERKNINFQNNKLIFNNIFYKESKEFTISLKYLEKNYFLNTLFEGNMIQRGDAYLLFWEFQEKKNINFQNIKLTFNSIFYKESKEFTFAEISWKELLLEPSFWKQHDTKGGPLSNFLRISREKNILIFKILN